MGSPNLAQYGCISGARIPKSAAPPAAYATKEALERSWGMLHELHAFVSQLSWCILLGRPGEALAEAKPARARDSPGQSTLSSSTCA